MNWIIAIIIFAIIGAIIGFLNSGKTEDAVGGAIVGGMGCGYIIFQILLALVGLSLLLAIGGWLFG